MTASRRVLIVGIVLADKINLADTIARDLATSRDWQVEQKWVAIGQTELADNCPPIVARLRYPEPKFTILNRLLSAVKSRDYEFVIVTDDDIELPSNFLDKYLGLVREYDFALAQPARSHDSYIDHAFVEQLDGITARRTRFVEIGPLFSMRLDALNVLTPFDGVSPMGWGYDFAWPLVIETAGLKMGIVDAVPIAHKLRKPVANYVHSDASEQMRAYFSRRPHLEKPQAFHIIESFT